MAKRPQSPPKKAAHLSDAEKKAAIPRLEKRIADLKSLNIHAISSVSDPTIHALEQELERTLAAIFGIDTVEMNRYSNVYHLTMSVPLSYMSATPTSEVQKGLSKGTQSAILTLEGIIKGFKEDIDEFSQLTPVTIATEDNVPKNKVNARKVFLVHGHDNEAKETVARFLSKLELIPIILHEQASGGRTIIEKIEQYSDVDFAVILLTPDDVGASNAEAKEGNYKPRARQNVILELGYFMSKLGRKNVCALKKGDVESAGDIDGVIYVSMGSDWKTELAKEISAAGINIDFNLIFK